MVIDIAFTREAKKKGEGRGSGTFSAVKLMIDTLAMK